MGKSKQQLKREKCMRGYFTKKKKVFIHILSIIIIIALAAVTYLYLSKDVNTHQILGYVTCGFAVFYFICCLIASGKTYNFKKVCQVIKADHDRAYSDLSDYLGILKTPMLVAQPIEVESYQEYPGEKLLVKYEKKHKATVCSATSYDWILFSTTSFLHYSAKAEHVKGLITACMSDEVAYSSISHVSTVVTREKGLEQLKLVIGVKADYNVVIVLRSVSYSEANEVQTHPLTENEKLIIKTVREVIRNNK